jgi:hypothetical protein
MTVFEGDGAGAEGDVELLEEVLVHFSLFFPFLPPSHFNPSPLPLHPSFDTLRSHRVVATVHV